MRTIHAPKTRAQLRYRRHLRVRQKVAGTAERPRLVVFRSLKHIYAQLVNDDLGVTLLGVGDTQRGHPDRGRGQGGPRQGGRASCWPRRPRRRASPGWCSTAPATVTMVACRPSPTARAKADWSSKWLTRRAGTEGATPAGRDPAAPSGRRRAAERPRPARAAAAGGAGGGGGERGRPGRPAPRPGRPRPPERPRRERDRHQPRGQGREGRPAVLVQRAGGGGRRQEQGRHRDRQGQRGQRGGPEGRGRRQAHRWWSCPRPAPPSRTRSWASTAPAGCCSSPPPPVPASSPAARCARCSSAPASPTS